MTKKTKIGYACTPASLPYRTSRTFILKNFNEKVFTECTAANLEDLMSILNWNVKNHIYMFRISSDIIPFASHQVNKLKWWEIFEQELLKIGAFIKQNDIRVSMHPGQYTVLNSPKEEVVENSIADLEYHCRFLDTLGVDYTNKIVLHVGGVYGDKASAMRRFMENFKKLSPSLKKRLVLENDDKCYTVTDVLEICSHLKIPAVFDNLHHKLNPCTLKWDQLLLKVQETWTKADGKVKLHYSDQDLVKKGGAHSKSVVTANFLHYLESIKNIDANVMLEVKDKEISAIKCIYAIDDDLPVSNRTDQWAKYKYSIMEKNYSFYKRCSGLVNSQVPMSQVYVYIDQCLSSPNNEGSFINAAQHVYGYVKDMATKKEKESFINLINSPQKDTVKIKSLLKRLCKKYNAEYVNESYYFIL